MEQKSTPHLLLLHAYNETNGPQREFLAKELAKDPVLHEDLIDFVKVKRMLNGKMLCPSHSSVRIIMEHSYKTEHLQEI